MSPKETTAWVDLQSHAYYMSQSHISTLFSESPDRFAQFGFTQDNLLLDLSKQRITDETLNLLIELAKERNLPNWIESLFKGDHINDSEDRPALHTALRTPKGTTLEVDGVEIIEEVHQNLERMEAIVDKIIQVNGADLQDTP